VIEVPAAVLVSDTINDVVCSCRRKVRNAP
jgi:hypothetical protein